MQMKKNLIRTPIIVDNSGISDARENLKKKYFHRILVSGIFSFILLIIIILTLPRTILSVSSLIEYATIVALVIFLFVLLIRYFGILSLAYLYLNEYTFKTSKNYFPFVSIIVPVFNESRVIRDSIRSLLKLDYSNYEIIIVNDGSTDNTKEVAETLVGHQKGKLSLIKVSLINQPNGGKSRALNTGIKHSQAEIVLCMDGDSQLSPEAV